MSQMRTMIILMLMLGLFASHAQGQQFASEKQLPITQATPAPGFHPVVRSLGLPTSEGNIEWVITVSNMGDTPGDTVTIRDELVTALKVETVQIQSGTASIDGQNITIVLPTLAPNESARFSIITTPLVDDAVITNTICVTANNYTGEECAVAMPVQALPATGELPRWRSRLQLMSLIGISISLLMIGIGLAGWRVLHATPVYDLMSAHNPQSY